MASFPSNFTIRHQFYRGLRWALLPGALALAACTGYTQRYDPPAADPPPAKEEINRRYKILEKGQHSDVQLARFLIDNNEKIKFKNAHYLANLYILESKDEGVNHDLAFAQMCLETGFLKFDGIVKAHQNNFGGIGAVNEHDPGDSFPSVKIGIRAQIQHLKAYATDDSFNKRIVDTRLSYVERGSAPTVFGLTNRWAVDDAYGWKIKGLIDRLYAETAK